MKVGLIVITLLLIISLYLIFQPTIEDDVVGDIHIHADFKVYLDGAEYNFSKDKYMSNQNKALSNFLHLHDGDGDIIHQHISEVTVGNFFQTIGMKFNSTCFVLDNGTSYCNEEDKTLNMYVNGKQNFEYENYEFKDLDRILITFGSYNSEAIQQQIHSITDKACIQSGSCPERGAPSQEYSCLAENGCVVENHEVS